MDQKKRRDKAKYMAELAMIRNLSSVMILKTKKGRLQNLYKRLVKLVDLEFRPFVDTSIITDTLKKHPELLKEAKLKEGMEFEASTHLKDIAQEMIDKFIEKTGFNDKRHVMVHISFITGLVEESEHPFNPKIITILNDITEFLERKNHHYVQSDMTAAIALDIWNEIE